MTALLSLKKKTSLEMLVARIPRPASGIPINALPGWAEVPLFNKLPMLKCPTDQIIFSKNKIGKEITRIVGTAFRIYDPYMQLLPSAYNSLDDPHLRKYYQKESILKRLREVKKITENNDVLCTLREFNSYRSLLQEYHLGLIHNEIKKRESEKQDRALVAHAEYIADKECNRFAKLRRRFEIQDVLKHKEADAKRRQEKIAALLKRLKMSVDRIEKIRAIRKKILAQKTLLYNLIIKQHKIAAFDLERKRIIALKKRYFERDQRLNTFHKQRTIKKIETAKQKALQRWELQLESRQKQHERNTKLLKEAEERAQRNIKRRQQKLEKQWRRIQEAIAKRAMQHKSLKYRKKKKKSRKIKPNTEDKEKFSKEKMLLKSLEPEIIPQVVNVALDIEETLKKLEEYPDSSVKMAEYILDAVIKTFKTDLSKNKKTMDLLSRRIAVLFQKLKTIQIVKVNAILKHSLRDSRDSTLIKNFERSVSFGISTSIGLTLQKVQSDIELKHVRSRDPTPAGSLEAIAPVVYARHSDESDTNESNSECKTFFAHCTDEERIFIEHYYIKFRRALIVGVSKRIFDAIRCYRNNHILNPSKELLDIDRHYLVTTMAKSILSYAINEYNFESNLKLCINALSADIIYQLQQGFLKPTNDIRYMRPPKCRCSFGCSGFAGPRKC